MASIFSNDFKTDKEHVITEGKEIADVAAIISTETDEEIEKRSAQFVDEIEDLFITNFEKTERAVALGKAETADKMVHVSTFCVINGMIYTTYYANTKNATEDPTYQTARLVYCPVDNPDNKTFLDIQSVGDTCSGLPVNLVYDTILAKASDELLYVLWTAKVGDNYYRLST